MHPRSRFGAPTKAQEFKASSLYRMLAAQFSHTIKRIMETWKGETLRVTLQRREGHRNRKQPLQDWLC